MDEAEEPINWRNPWFDHGRPVSVVFKFSLDSTTRRLRISITTGVCGPFESESSHSDVEIERISKRIRVELKKAYRCNYCHEDERSQDITLKVANLGRQLFEILFPTDDKRRKISEIFERKAVIDVYGDQWGIPWEFLFVGIPSPVIDPIFVGYDNLFRRHLVDSMFHSSELDASDYREVFVRMYYDDDVAKCEADELCSLFSNLESFHIEAKSPPKDSCGQEFVEELCTFEDQYGLHISCHCGICNTNPRVNTDFAYEDSIEMMCISLSGFLISSDDFEMHLRDHRIDFAFLNCCYSGDKPIFYLANISESLLRKGVGSIIAGYGKVGKTRHKILKVPPRPSKWLWILYHTR